ncbi:hypothetical protein C7974DRAFT_224475 [Boeremia exigua]|uniref:uncharacterized protein n=1 Tax=Boeremia exigua TaxID=749465 RepID=UPI001E8DADB2|nr:uncharacterized protein C7974DRAFT_224475 [Boeremia exigua]KAH6620005.1 hypothetical protein C7974DRAFT_224475 [Boeremia exigua]
MTARNQIHAVAQTPELILSDPEDDYASSDEEMPDREEMDGLLRQAHHYVITEGGSDSPTTYMERIQRIDQSLIQEIADYNYDCDRKLCRRVKQKIDHVMREYEDAVDDDSYGHTFPKYHATAAKSALYRKYSQPTTPDGRPVQLDEKDSNKDELQRTYLYGGPDNHPENWYKKTAGSLPFPETIRMAEWESLRIHWDLATTGDMDNKAPVTFNGVSFNDSRLKRLNHLKRYESGSRFELTKPDPNHIAMINEFCTVGRLRNAVDTFNRSNDSRREDGEYEYAPRVFLERLDIGPQVSPADELPSEVEQSEHEPELPDINHIVDDVRKVVNTTPSKPRHSPSSNSAPEVLSAIRRIKAATDDSILSSDIPQSPPALSGTNQAAPTKKPRRSPGNIPATQKRKRGSEINVEVETVSAKRVRATTEPVRPRTPTITSPSELLHTPVVTPALSMGSASASSTASSPPIAKAIAAGKKHRKIRTKKDFEERVTPEKYSQIMAQRRSVKAQGHESVARGSTRSGKLRK